MYLKIIHRVAIVFYRQKQLATRYQKVVKTVNYRLNILQEKTKLYEALRKLSCLRVCLRNVYIKAYNHCCHVILYSAYQAPYDTDNIFSDVSCAMLSLSCTVYRLVILKRSYTVTDNEKTKGEDCQNNQQRSYN